MEVGSQGEGLKTSSAGYGISSTFATTTTRRIPGYLRIVNDTEVTRGLTSCTVKEAASNRGKNQGENGVNEQSASFWQETTNKGILGKRLP